jgi:hypothetical protein
MVLLAVAAVAFLATLLIGSSLLWFYRGPIRAHLGKPGMALLVLGLALFFLDVCCQVHAHSSLM